VATKLKGEGIEILSYHELIAEGEKIELNLPGDDVTVDTIYSFCYTSGTTGPPKGALISHENLLAAISSFNLHHDLAFGAADVYLSYLPLPHLMERTIANCMFLAGAFLVYSDSYIGFHVAIPPKSKKTARPSGPPSSFLSPGCSTESMTLSTIFLPKKLRINPKEHRSKRKCLITLDKATAGR
jgi:acyl-CoA synthetase (AMP-forming)/AMP-acid ligase II